MKILSGNQIAKAVANCHPTRVAVAYIGADWRKFIPNPSQLAYVVVSPTLGSNPKAVSDLVEAITWEKVFFLDELHAKIFSGPDSAVIGSANLTRNGLSGEGLVELGVEISSAPALERIKTELDHILARAKKGYGDREAKQKRLQNLFVLWNRAIANAVIPKPPSATMQFEQFRLLGKSQFYVCWYEDDNEWTYSDTLKARANQIHDEMHFTSTDPVESGRWILAWPITAKYKPTRGSRPKWMYIHDVFEDAIVDEGYEYPKCAVQWKRKPLPPKPFEITREFAEAFNRAIVDKRLASTLLQKNKVWSLRVSFDGVTKLAVLVREGLGKEKKRSVHERAKRSRYPVPRSSCLHSHGSYSQTSKL
jgi:hypothetical protein